MGKKKLMYRIFITIGLICSFVDIDFSPSFTDSQKLYVIVKFLGLSILIIGLMGLPKDEAVFGLWKKKK
ncbi:MAG: hypothetical protein H8E60_04785 [Candidatus Marinimicrobia bacterium]|nr:hypothetical protein [Candidatus Neomarinimicrobiota bacterium]